MKIGEFRNMTNEELVRSMQDLKSELFRYRFQHSTGQLEKTHRMGQVRKDIARAKTVLRQRELEAVAAQGESK